MRLSPKWEGSGNGRASGNGSESQENQTNDLLQWRCVNFIWLTSVGQGCTTAILVPNPADSSLKKEMSHLLTCHVNLKDVVAAGQAWRIIFSGIATRRRTSRDRTLSRLSCQRMTAHKPIIKIEKRQKATFSGPNLKEIAMYPCMTCICDTRTSSGRVNVRTFLSLCQGADANLASAGKRAAAAKEEDQGKDCNLRHCHLWRLNFANCQNYCIRYAAHKAKGKLCNEADCILHALPLTLEWEWEWGGTLITRKMPPIPAPPAKFLRSVWKIDRLVIRSSVVVRRRGGFPLRPLSCCPPSHKVA